MNILVSLLLGGKKKNIYIFIYFFVVTQVISNKLSRTRDIKRILFSPS